jgi:hypothetical protein
MVTRFTKKGLQSRSTTASLLTVHGENIKSVLAQESEHIVSSCCWRKQRCMFPAERKAMHGYNGYNGG